jgi:zinc transport system permease protein
LALGLLLTPEPELLEALFGNISQVGWSDFVYVAFLAPLILVEMRAISRQIMLGIISRDMAVSMGIDIEKSQLRFFLLVAVVVALGLKIVGTLLMGALVIIPAAAARNISSTLSRYTQTSAVLGALSGGVGILISSEFGLAPGPAVVLTSGALFGLTLIFKRTL